MRLVGFKKAHQTQIKKFMERKQPIHIDDCQIKEAKRGKKLEILLKNSTKITTSPKKIDTTNMTSSSDLIPLIDIDSKEEYEKVTTKVKVIKILQKITTASGKQVQELAIGDATHVTKCSLCINSLTVGSSYMLKYFQVNDFGGKKFLTKPKVGSDAVPIEDIGMIPDALYAELESKEEEIHNAQIIGVPQLMKYKSCLRCKARVEPSDPPFGRCSKEECRMYQRYDICKMQLSVKLLVLANNEQLALFAYGQTVLDIANFNNMEAICEEFFLQLPPFATIKYNNQQIITKFAC